MRTISLIMGFLYFVISMVFLPYVLFIVNQYLSLPFTINYILRLFGILSSTAGFFLLSYSVLIFMGFGRGGTPLPTDPPRQLVTVGIYKYIRNPMFLASGLIWFGEFFATGALLLFFYALTWVTINHLVLILHDEKNLEKKYSQEYLNYKLRTPRYFPKISLPNI